LAVIATSIATRTCEQSEMKLCIVTELILHTTVAETSPSPRFPMRHRSLVRWLTNGELGRL
jgi:hypothetical protein